MDTTEHYTIKIFIYEIEPQIWRRFSVPTTVNFFQLHQIIQRAMGWLDLQEHEFLHGKGKKLDQIIGDTSNDHASSDFFRNEKKVLLADFVGRKKTPLRILYRYDFTEEWIHEIVIESKDNNSTDQPVMLEGKKACPIEDSGGAWEHKACLEGESEWMEDGYDPDHFDIGEVTFKKLR